MEPTNKNSGGEYTKMKILLIPIMLLLMIGIASAALTDDLIRQHSFTNGLLTANNGATTLTQVGLPLNTTGKINQAYNFTVIGMHFYYTNTTRYTNITLKAWVYKYNNHTFDDGNMNTILGAKDWTASNGWYKLGTSKTDQHIQTETYATTGSCDQDTGIVLPEQVWVMLTNTVDGTNGNVSIYLNDTLIYSVIDNDCKQTWRPPEYINGWGYAGRDLMELFMGAIDEISIWDRWLSTSEISTIYSSEQSGTKYPWAIAPPNILQNTYNMTTALSTDNSTKWRTNTSYPIKTLDTTPTMSFDTDAAAYCRIDIVNQNWTLMGNTKNCSTTGGSSHVCTLPAAVQLTDGITYQSLFIACIDTTLTYGNTTSTSGDLNVTLLFSNLTFGIMNKTRSTVVNLSEGQEFKFWANSSWLANGTAINSTCYLNVSNVSVERYNESMNVSICLGGSCTSTNYTHTMSMDTSQFTFDTVRFRLCKNGVPFGTVHWSTNCNNDTIHTITASELRFCSAGYSNYTFEPLTACVNGSSTVNLSIWSDGNTFNKGVRLYLIGIDRWRDEVNLQLPLNASSGLHESVNWFEEYSHGTKNYNITCYYNDTYDFNQSSFFVINRNPSAFLTALADYYSGKLAFTDGISMRYPNSGNLNVSALCSDDDLASWQLNLSYDANSTLIFSSSGSVGNITQQYLVGNFSTADNFLNGVLGYKLSLLCKDTQNATGSASKSFFAIDNLPTCSWNDGTSIIIGSVPHTFNFTMSDTETSSALLLGIVMENGSMINPPLPGMTGYNFSNTTGYYNLSLYCYDGVRNSAQHDIMVTYTDVCALNLTGLQAGMRYRELEQSISWNCTNGVGMTNCGISINEFAYEAFSNCSSAVVTLEKGWNRINFTVNKGSAVQSDETFNVFAYSQTGSFWDYPLMLYLSIITVLLFIIGVAFSSPLVFGLMMVAGLRLAYEFLALSIVASVIVAVLSIGVGMLSMIYRKKQGLMG